MILSQVDILRGVLKVTFQKTRVFSSAGRRATERKRERQPRVSYHIKARTLYARRIFREKRYKTLHKRAKLIA